MTDRELRADLAKLIVKALGVGTGKHETSVIREIFDSLNAAYPHSGGRFPANLLKGGRPDPERVARALAAAAPTAEVLLNELVRVGGRFMAMVQEVYDLLSRHAVTIGGNQAAEKFRFERGGIDETRLIISPAFIERWRHVCESVQQVELGWIDEDALRSFVGWDGAFYGRGPVESVDFDRLAGWVLAMNRNISLLPGADTRAAEQLIGAAEELVRVRIASLTDPGGRARDGDGPASGERSLFQATGVIGITMGDSAIAGTGDREGISVIGLTADLTPVRQPVVDGWPTTPVGALAAFVAMWRLGLVPASRAQPVATRDLPARPADRAEWLNRYRAACGRATRWLTDEVFTSTGVQERTALVEMIKEFLNLPLWQQRELLYEIWVLCATFGACEQAGWNVQPALTRRGDEWVLQVGRSSSPVATLQHSKQQSITLDVWREPARQAGGQEFTPDVTVSTTGPYTLDLLVVEAKDRVKMSSGLVRGPTGNEPAGERTALAVARRYAEALRPRAVWVCNHCDFRQPAKAEVNHGTDWTEIRLADQFRPGQVPDAFTESVRHALALPARLRHGIVLVLDVTGSMRRRLTDALNTLGAASTLRSYGQFRAVLYSDHGDGEPLLVRKVGPYDNLAGLLDAVTPLPTGDGHDTDEALEDALQRCRELVDDTGSQDLLILTDAPPHPAGKCPYGIDYQTEIWALRNAGCRLLFASDWWNGEPVWNAFKGKPGFSFAPLKDLLAAVPPA
jgi:hypothetical protein